MDDVDSALIEILREGIPIADQPYREIGKKLGLDGNEVISRIKKLRDDGIIKNLRASVTPEKIGFPENSMTVWNVPEDRLDEVAKTMAQFEEVTHCYQRPRIPGKWPYTLFCMLHGPTKNDIEKVAQRISQTVGIDDYWFCFATKEYIDVGTAHAKSELL